jgi:hypothetical protein
MVGVGPSPGSAVLQLVVVWQAKKAAAEKKAAEEAEKVRSSPALDGCGLRRTASDTCSCVERRHRFHAHTSALCRTTRACDCAWACVCGSDGGDCVCDRIAVVAGSIDFTARSAMWNRGQCAVGTHMRAHERT